MRLSGFFLFFMTLDALEIHHFLFLQLAILLECFNGVSLLGKDAVANFAVLELILVLGVGKGNVALAAAEDINVVGSSVGSIDHGHGED
jgi:hypothetical protein